MRELQHKEDAGFLVIVKHIIKWRKPILAITLIAIIGAIVFSMPTFMPPKFKSTVVFYPTSTNSISQSLLAQNPGLKADILAFGEEEEAEQLLQILESDAISSKMIDKYNLMERYEIDQGDEYKNTTLAEEYHSNVNFNRNEHMAIEVSVYDTDPQVAANMANDIVRLMDSAKTYIQKNRAYDALQIVESEYRTKVDEIKAIEDTLEALGKLGVINNVEQAQAITEAFDHARRDYYDAKARGVSGRALEAYQERLDEVKRDYQVLARYGGKWQSTKEGLILQREQLERLKEKYSQAKVDAEKELSHKFIINNAVPAEKKAKPVRSLIVIFTAFSSFLLSALLFVLYEIFRKNRDWLLSNS